MPLTTRFAEATAAGSSCDLYRDGSRVVALSDLFIYTQAKLIDAGLAVSSAERELLCSVGVDVLDELCGKLRTDVLAVEYISREQPTAMRGKAELQQFFNVPVV